VTKYGARQTVASDGTKHPSAKQAKRWDELLLLQRAGVIHNLEREVPIRLIGRNGFPLRSPSGRTLTYRADAAYDEGGNLVYEDSKGVETPVFKLKRAILAAQGITLRIT
jgi:hypothetical protein